MAIKRPVNTVSEMAATLQAAKGIKLLDHTSHKNLGNFVNHGESREKMLAGFGNARIENREVYKTRVILYI